MVPVKHRVAAAAILAIVIAICAAGLGVPTWLLHRHYDTHLDNLTDKLARYRRVAELRPEIDAALEEVRQQDASRFYLRSATPALAGAELQGAVSSIIEISKGRLITSQILHQRDTDDTKDPAKVSLQIQFYASITPLQLILHAVESHQPLLFIDKLSITSGLSRGYRPTLGVQPEFQVLLTLSAYLLPPGVAK
jgi:hypothetical protein